MTSMVIPGFEEAVERVALDRLKLSQWHTPFPLAQRIVQWSGIAKLGEDAHILEPSAGGGVFLDALAAEGFRGKITAVELDPKWATKLATPGRFSLDLDVSIANADYLTRPAPARRYDACVQNPPYEGGKDGLFLAKAMDESIRVIGLIRTVAMNGDERFKTVWRRCNSDGDFIVRKLANLALRPDFGGADSAATDFSVVFLARRGVDETSPIEWWPR
jgi:predicted RNA methylase